MFSETATRSLLKCNGEASARDIERVRDGSRSSNNKTILFITHVGEAGGAEYKMVDLCRAMRDSAEVMLLQRGSLEAVLNENRIKHCVCPLPSNARIVRKEDGIASVLKAIPAALSMVKRIARKAEEFDIVVCFSQKSFVLTSLAKLLARRPIIWFMNDILSPAHFSRVLIGVLVTLSRYSADHIVVNSRASLAAWFKAGGRRKRVSVLYPGTNSKLADQRPSAELIASYKQKYSPDAKPLIGMFGRISRWKGQDVFIRAIAQVPNVNAVVVGGALFGEQQHERRMKELVTELGITRRVTFTGHVDDVMNLMAACDVVAHCSTSPEPFGQVIVEAMLAGTPVIASDAGGAREIVTPDETGQLTRPSSHSDLEAAIRRYLDSPSWSRQVAERAKVSALEKFSETAMTTGFLEILEAF